MCAIVKLLLFVGPRHLKTLYFTTLFSLLTVTSATTFLALIPQGERLMELMPYGLFPTLSGRRKGRTVCTTVFAGCFMLIKEETGLFKHLLLTVLYGQFL